MKYCITTLIFILMVSAGTLFAQKLDFSFFIFNKQNGLPDNTIYYTFQDKEGFLWFCSGRGLLRYDGYSFKRYGKDFISEAPGFTSDRPVHIMQDHNGFLWISTSDQGVFVYNPALELFTHYYHLKSNPGSLSDNDVYRVFQDSRNRIWICTLGEGLDLFDPLKRRFKHFIHNASDSLSIPDNNVTSMIEDLDGTLWVATRGRYICQFDPQKGTFVRYHTSFSNGLNMDSYFKHFYQTDSSSLWIATYGSGLYQFNLKHHQFKRYCHNYKPNELSSNNVEAIIPYNKHFILIATDGGGLNILDLNSGNISRINYNFLNQNGLTTNALYSLLKDQSHNIWIGTFRGGLLLIKNNSKNFKIISQSPDNEGLSYKSVLCILCDSYGNTWYGTDGGGLDCYSPKTHKFRYYRYIPADTASISNNVVTVLYEDHSGSIWAGTFFGGLNKFNPVTGKFKRYQFHSGQSNGIGSNNTWCIFEDSRQMFWIGNFSSGLDLLDRKTGAFRHFRPEENDSTSLSHTQVSSIVEDNKGNLWVGTLHGLNLMNRKTFKFRRFFHNPKDKNSLSDDKINCLFYDSNGRLWIGTDDGGLDYMIRPGRFKTFDKSSGLPDNSVQSIQEDRNGNLWISTKSGLAKFEPGNEEFFNFDAFEGLISNEFNWNSSFYSKDNYLYFGSVDGVVVFNPDRISFGKPFPKVVITDLRIFNNSVIVGKKYHGRIILNRSTVYGGNVVLTPGENEFSIDFSSLEFNHPAKIKYRYRLLSFDSTWVYTGSPQRMATYTNLPGGDFIFQVTSTNSDGIWNSHITSLRITLIPPFYNTLWFRVLFVFLLIFLIYSLFKRKVGKHRKRIQELALKREKELTEKRNEELKAEIASSTMLLLKKNESIELIRNQLNELPVHIGDGKKLKDLVALLEHEMETDEYWEQFQYNFDQVYRNLLSKLKTHFPELTQTNLKLCAYLRMNLSTKEIASLMNVTTGGTDKARNRLRKKLGLQPSDDLYDFLLNL